ncbi:MCE family protein [Pseudonocardia xishanensis]|uniref:MCE family protein n=1 Tax=Pseudonocardia xishanensis TaxID=630995 RepID=A0ABP8RTI9_9PSEU
MRHKIYALVMLGIIGGFVALCVAVANEAFTPYARVSLKADRAGLQMYPGNRVQLRGVDVGEVDAVALADGGDAVDIALNIDPDLLDMIPSNVGVALNQLTAFGAKTVSLVEPESPSARNLAAGDLLSTGRITVEVNNLFENLDGVLATASPSKVNAVLGSVAQALDGKGDELGDTAVRLGDYLRRFNENLPTLQRDFAKGADTAQLYSDIAPDLGAILSNFSTTSRTIVEQQAQIDSFLFQVTRAGDIGGNFLAENGDRLMTTVRTALPTTALLSKYSPMFPCFLQGLDHSNRRAEHFFGGEGQVAAINGNVSFEPGEEVYTYPNDLPEVDQSSGPQCHGLPDLDGARVPDSAVDVQTPPEGTNEQRDSLRVGDPPLVVQLFGPLAGAPLTTEPGATGALQQPGSGGPR